MKGKAMYETKSATELTAILIEPHEPEANVWLRKNIHTEEIEIEEGNTQILWVAEETHGILSPVPTMQYVEDNFNRLWQEFDLNEKTDHELIMQALQSAEQARAQADFTAIITDTEIG